MSMRAGLYCATGESGRRPDRSIAVAADQLGGGDLHPHRWQTAGDLAEVVDHHLADQAERLRDAAGSVT